MYRVIRRLTMVIALLLVLPASTWADVIGKVILTQGSPMVERDNHKLPVKRNDKLHTGDSITTPAGSKILFRLNDGSTISLAENSQFELTHYNFDKKSHTSSASFTMLKGAFRTLTGEITQQEKPQFEIQTPVATIGVRGTEFWGGFILSGALDVTMLEGKGVYIKNELGTVEITKPGQGTTVEAGSPPSPVGLWHEAKLQKAIAATALESETSTPSNDNEGY